MQRSPRGAGTAGAGPRRQQELQVPQQELRGDKWHLCSSATLWLRENPLFLVEKCLQTQNPAEFSTFLSHWQSELRGNLDATLPSAEQNLHNKTAWVSRVISCCLAVKPRLIWGHQCVCLIQPNTAATSWSPPWS